MKKNLKTSILSVLLIVVLLAISGCSKSSTSHAKLDPDNKNESKVEELNVWLPATAKDGNDEEIWNELVKPFEEENNAKINFQFISWKDYEAKFASGVSTGTGPDISRMYVEMFPTYIDANAVEDLTNYLTDEDYGQGFGFYRL